MDKFSQIDLRNEFDYLQNEFSISILLIRQQNLTRCKCYNQLTDCGSAKCKICGGSGRVNSIELQHPIIQTLSIDDSVTLTKIGMVSVGTPVFYFNYKVQPQERDLILVVGFDKHNIPVDIKSLYVITSVEELRADKGRVEYFRVYSKLAPERIVNTQKRLNAIPLKSKRAIMKGRIFKWPSC